MKWFTADLHLGHQNILKYCDRKFKDINLMDYTILQNIKRLVKEDDDFFILGDLTMYGPSQRDKIEAYVKKIPGHKHLILGNHDRCKPFSYIDMGFTSVHTSLDVEEFTLVHDPAIAGVIKDKKYLCGHVHQLFLQQGGAYNVGIDMHDFKPISINMIRQEYDIGTVP